MSDYGMRFGGMARLYGQAGLERLRRAHVCVVGVGGVGSWAVEALARSGVGELTLIDLDDVCVSNINRQLPALDGEIGKPKVEVLAARMKLINPEINLHALPEFFTEESVERHLKPRFDFVIDAIDRVSNKCHLLAGCRQRALPIITIGSAGGRRDATLLRIADLSQTSHDPLLQKVRKKLRQDFLMATEPKSRFEIPCVYSIESPVFPQEDGTVCATRAAGTEGGIGCETGYGSATFVTGAFGFAAAAHAVKAMANPESQSKAT